ncbi:MAG: ABC transporter ATP-binding protein [Clostridiales bacterium]|nr:ABC transporter ATP-binding protein [Clostridiales bacterium]
MLLCEIRKLRKTYPSFILSDMTFSLDSGRIVGFIGRNGAGKTTTIKSMLGLVHSNGGDIRYFGLPFSGHEKEIKQRIGYSTGAVNYYPKKKIRDIVDVTRTFFDTWDEDAYDEYLSLFALDENKIPSELSEGMRVKFNLLLALSHKAEILILDEPTSGLDPFSRDELLDIFSELRDRGISILFSTHITSDIEKCADDIMYIRKGSLVANCSKDYFIENICEAGESIEQAILRLERGTRV